MRRISSKQRVHNGFHRLGAAAAIPTFLAGPDLTGLPFGGIAMRGGFLSFIKHPPFVAGTPVACLASYSLVRLIGWIIAGFLDDS